MLFFKVCYICNMKLRSARILLFIILFSYTPLKEFLRLPYIIMHYVYHNEGEATMTISEFFLIHYLEKQIPDEDYAHDMQLPFKSLVEVCFSVHSYQITPQNIELSLLIPSESSERNNYNYTYTGSSAYLDGVFHPPQYRA